MIIELVVKIEKSSKCMCRRKIEGRLRNIKGIEFSDFSCGSYILTVGYDDVIVSEDEIIKRLEAGGYRVAVDRQGGSSSC